MATFVHVWKRIEPFLWLVGMAFFGSAATAAPNPLPEPDLAKLPAWAQQRVAPTKRALVVGISDYLYAKDLLTPQHDAEQVSKTLIDLDPQIDLTLLTQGPGSNLGRDELLDKFEAFRDRLRPGDIAVVYFSGHGIEVGGINYLVPANAELSEPTEETSTYISLPYVTDLIQGTGAAITLIVLDACRTNPFSAPTADEEYLDLQRPPPILPQAADIPRQYLTRKKPAPGVPPTDFLVFFAAEAGKPAFSFLRGETEKDLSIFTRNLVGLLTKENRPADKVFWLIKKAVARVTKDHQVPFIASSTGGDVMFLDNQNLAKDEQEDWFYAVYDVTDDELMSTLPAFLDSYPAGPFSAAARKQLVLLEASRVVFSPSVVSIDRDVGLLGGSLRTPAVVNKLNTTAFARYDLNVRNAPSAAKSKVLANLRQGQQVEVLSGKTPRGWAEVMLGDGQIGYIGSVSAQSKAAESIRLVAGDVPGAGVLAEVESWRGQLAQGRASIEISLGEVSTENPTQAKRLALRKALRIRALLKAQGVERSQLALRLHSPDVPANTVNIRLMKEVAR